MKNGEALEGSLLKVLLKEFYEFLQAIHPATRRFSDIVATSLCTSQDVVGMPQMKHPTTSQWKVAKMSQWYLSTTPYWNVVTTSQDDVTATSHQSTSTKSRTSVKWNTQKRLSSTSPRRLSGTHPRRSINTPLRRLLSVLNETSDKVIVVRFHQVSELRCSNVLLVGL